MDIADAETYRIIVVITVCIDVGTDKHMDTADLTQSYRCALCIVLIKYSTCSNNDNIKIVVVLKKKMLNKYKNKQTYNLITYVFIVIVY